MKILIVGNKGMLGSDMILAAKGAGHEVSGIDYPEIDITRVDSIRPVLNPGRYDCVVNCAAFTAVDLCEKEKDKAFAVNATGAGNLARVAKEAGCVFVHYSTDYVFDGSASRPYLETDQPNPATVYGKSKLEGERQVLEANERSFIIRIAWLYGLYGNNFARTICRVAEKNLQAGKPLRVVSDQYGSPTWTVDVCRQTLRLLETTHFGLYHGTSEGECSWFDFTEEILQQSGIPLKADPCTTAEYLAEFPQAALRPRYSVLENASLKKLGLNLMPLWRDAFSAYMKQGRQERI